MLEKCPRSKYPHCDRLGLWACADWGRLSFRSVGDRIRPASYGQLGFAVAGISGTMRRLPMFGRGAVVDGRVEVLHPETVVKIEAKVCQL